MIDICIDVGFLGLLVVINWKFRKLVLLRLDFYHSSPNSFADLFIRSSFNFDQKEFLCRFLERAWRSLIWEILNCPTGYFYEAFTNTRESLIFSLKFGIWTCFGLFSEFWKSCIRLIFFFFTHLLRCMHGTWLVKWRILNGHNSRSIAENKRTSLPSIL